MKKILLSLFLVSTAAISAQTSTETSKTALISSTVTKEYKPDNYKVYVTIKEYENTNPDDQKVTRFSIAEVELALTKKLEELGIKSASISVTNLEETIPAQNNFNYNLNYTATQKREMSKTISFDVKTIKELEKVFLTLRINGVYNVYAQPSCSEESQLKIETELLQMAMEKARTKANKMEIVLGKKLGNVVLVNENPVINDNNIINYNNYYRYGNSMTNGLCSKSLMLTITYSIE